MGDSPLRELWYHEKYQKIMDSPSAIRYRQQRRCRKHVSRSPEIDFLRCSYVKKNNGWKWNDLSFEEKFVRCRFNLCTKPRTGFDIRKSFYSRVIEFREYSRIGVYLSGPDENQVLLIAILLPQILQGLLEKNVLQITNIYYKKT